MEKRKEQNTETRKNENKTNGSIATCVLVVNINTQ